MEKARDEPSGGAVRGAIRLSRLRLRPQLPDAAVAAAKDAVSRDAENRLPSKTSPASNWPSVTGGQPAKPWRIWRAMPITTPKQLAVANLQLAAGNPSGGA